MNKNYPIIEIKPDGNPGWSNGAYCLIFVYSKYNGNFVIKGYSREAEKFIKENYNHYFYYKSFGHNGRSRGYWEFWKNNITILQPSKSNKRKKYEFIKHIEKKDNSGGVLKYLLFKRMPKRWIPEFNNLG